MFTYLLQEQKKKRKREDQQIDFLSFPLLNCKHLFEVHKFIPQLNAELQAPAHTDQTVGGA